MSESEEDLKAGRAVSPALGGNWFPSTWGPDDEICAGNLLGPEKTLAAAQFFSDASTWYDGARGLGLLAARFLSKLQPSMVGADNFAVDVIPSVDPEFALPCHQHLMMRHGIYLHEGINLDELAEARRYEFAYVFSPLPIVGATGSPGRL